MDSLDRPVPAPRTGHHRHRRDYPGEHGYSSSDGEDTPADCLDKKGIGSRIHDSANSVHCRKPRSADSKNEPPRLKDGNRRFDTNHSEANRRDPNRLYNYLSGSDGEREAGLSKEPWQDRKSVSSSCSSIGSNVSSSPGCSPSRPGGLVPGYHDNATDTMDSSGIGENVYSKIKDNGCPTIPIIPPPPSETFIGPAVPPRRPTHVKIMNTSSTQTLERQRRHSGFVDDEEPEPHFLMHTTSGNIFIPPGPAMFDHPPVVPTFPRTVPRTISFPRDSQSRLSTADGSFAVPPQRPDASTYLPSEPNNCVSAGPMFQGQNRVPVDQGTAQPSDSKRIKNQIKEVDDDWPRYINNQSQNVTFNPNTTLLPTLPTYPSIHNDFRDYSRFSSASYQVKKRLLCHRTWKCAALILVSLTLVLSAIVGYLIALKIYNLSWGFDSDFAKSEQPNTSLDQPPKDSSVIVIPYQLGRSIEHEVPPYDFLRISFYLSDSVFVKFNLTVLRGAFIGVYGRKVAPPTHVQYDFFKVVDGEKIVMTSNKRRKERAAEVTAMYKTKDSTFVNFLEHGIWYISLYNDGPQPQKLAFLATWQDKSNNKCQAGCSGRGECLNGKCSCFPGYDGPNCNQSICPALCMGNGMYQGGRCRCFKGWTGSECQLPVGDCTDSSCGGNGKCVGGECICSVGFSGADCLEEVCDVDCLHGQCEKQRCVCDSGWSGAMCDRVVCDVRCSSHGFCDNGTCVCQPGWNGRHCTLDGCPNGCNKHGSCQLFLVGWTCICHDGWKGSGCEVAMEEECDNSLDDDGDGLTDCHDPDCCISMSCRESAHCRTAPDPLEILLRKQPPHHFASFYDRMRFLIEDDSVQSFASLSTFNQTQVSVIRGKVLTPDGSPLIGVRCSVVTQPLYGFTLTREQGLFDMLVNGGGSVTLHFQRQPFQVKKVTIMVPWNRMVFMDDVVLSLDDDDDDHREKLRPHCPGVIHDHFNVKPVVTSTWKHTQLSSCPSKSTIIPESQVLQESLGIPGTDIYLNYHSSDTYGYMSTIMILLTGSSIPPNLVSVHLRILVEGLVIEKTFEADVNIKYKYSWDRRNAYNQKLYGIVTASVRVGYKYEDCDHPFWEIQSATMNGYSFSYGGLCEPEIGGWKLNIHHTYNYQEGIVYMGDGSSMCLRYRPLRVVTVLGNGRQRRIDCKGCDGKADDNRLMAPVALASGRDGSLYIGDYNHIRKLSAGRDEVTSILQLSMPEIPYKYFMTVSPLDARLYISDHRSYRIIRVKTMGAVRDLTHNYEVIAGTGDQCVPGDKEKCGDSGLAINAKLFYPKGIAISKDGLVYFSDGANIRTIDENGFIHTIIGSQEPPRHWQPLPCHQVVNASKVTLQWPLSLAINPVDDTLHILDNNVVLKLTHDMQLFILAGRPMHCPHRNVTSDSGEHLSLATDALLEHPQHITFSPDGDLYIVESNGKDVNQIRVVDTTGQIHRYVGGGAKCNCRHDDCHCYNAREDLALNMLLDTPTAITVTPDGVLHIADMVNLRIHSIISPEPNPDRMGQFEVVNPPTREAYIFNRNGQHIATKNIATDQFIYNFTYTNNSPYGKLVKIIDGGGNVVSIRRDTLKQLYAKEFIVSNGQKGKLVMDVSGQLQAFTSHDNASTKFSYFGNTGLIEAKESSNGRTYLYEYDDSGRLSTVILPTGERMLLTTDMNSNGVLVSVVNEGNGGSVNIELNDNQMSVIRGEHKKTISYPNDGSTYVRYPFGTKISMETSNSGLRNPDLQHYIRRRIALPNNISNDAEWLYQARSEMMQKHSRRIKVNGETFLHLEYDRAENVETIFNRNVEKIMSVHYDRSGRPIQLLPNGPIEGFNISYNQQGHVTSWNRGEMSVVNVFEDKNMIEKKLANRVHYRYIYKNGYKATDIILPSGKQYQLHYDDFGNIRAITMPNLSRHHFHSLLSIGLYRQIYRPPDSHGFFIRDYNGAGQLMSIMYPSNHRRITYHYGSDEVTVFADWTDVTFKFNPVSGSLQSANLTDRTDSSYQCVLEFKSTDFLVNKHMVSFSGNTEGLQDVAHHYTYDQNLRLAEVETTVGNKAPKTMNFMYSNETGRLVRVQSFSFEYPRMHREVVRDINVEIITEFDRHDRVTDVWYRFNTFVVFNLEVKYDAMNRIHQWRRKIGSSDTKPYEYLYDIDGNVIEVLVTGASTWKYEMDVNNNIVKIGYYGNIRSIVVSQKDQVESNGQESYVFDQDGFLAQHDKETYEYDSFGRLKHAFELGKYDVRYFYDAHGRLVAKKDSSVVTVQFFYGSPQHFHRVTHMYEQKRLTEFLYDGHGKLFAMKRENDYFYIALDPYNSPIVVLNSVGSVVKQMEYDPLGNQIGDSASDFPFYFGYRGGIFDRTTKLVFLEGRVYDPQIGRWTLPNYSNFLDNIEQVASFPELSNLYRNVFLWKRNPLPEESPDISSLLSQLGYDQSSMLPSLNLAGWLMLTPSFPHGSHHLQGENLMSVMTTFECAFAQDMSAFVRTSVIPTTKIMPAGRTSWSIGQTLSPLPPLFGRGVFLSLASGGKVVVTILDSANSALAMLATTLLNSSDSVGLHYTMHGRDMHHFVKMSLDQASDDLRELALRPEGVVQGLNVSVHRHHERSDIKFVEVRIHGNHTAVILRYGATVEQERERILRHARQRAMDGAWIIERELVQSGKLSVNSWSKSQREELLSKGQVAGMQARYIRNISEFPELADDPRNIKFTPDAMVGI